MRVSTIVIVLVIIGGAVWYANKKGYIGQAKEGVAQSFEAHFQKAQALYQASQYAEAIAEFQRAIDLEPQERRVPDAMFRIGHCYRDTGDKAKAIEMYQKVISGYPDNPNRGMVERALEQVR